MEQVFTAAARWKASQEADKWLAQQRGLRIVGRTEMTVGSGGLSLAGADKWIVTIHYEL